MAATTAQEEFDQLMSGKSRKNGHPEDADARSFLNLSDEDDDEDRSTPTASVAPTAEATTRPSMSASRHTIPLTRYGANTGPKGVISDAQHFLDQRRMQRRSSRSSTVLPSHSEAQEPSFGQRLRAEKLADQQEEELDDEDVDDEDFMSEWRQTRLKELQGGAYGSSMRSRGRDRRTFGVLSTVDSHGYLDAVEGSSADTVVVVYIYDEMVRSSGSLTPFTRRCC